MVMILTVLVCSCGIIGMPRSVSGLKENRKQRIKLGLDLRGGSHLVMQVQVQDAVKVEAQQAIERIKEELRKAGIPFASMENNEPDSIDTADTIQITIKGIPADKSPAFRSIVSDRFTTWIITAVNSTDYRLNMRPSELLTLKRDTVVRSIQTIGNRINALGLTEPVGQQEGSPDKDFRILCQLPALTAPAPPNHIIA